MLTRIENVFESLLKDLVAGKPMKFSFNKRGVSNNIWYDYIPYFLRSTIELLAYLCNRTCFC